MSHQEYKYINRVEFEIVGGRDVCANIKYNKDICFVKIYNFEDYVEEDLLENDILVKKININFDLYSKKQQYFIIESIADHVDLSKYINPNTSVDVMNKIFWILFENTVIYNVKDGVKEFAKNEDYEMQINLLIIEN